MSIQVLLARARSRRPEGSLGSRKAHLREMLARLTEQYEQQGGRKGFLERMLKGSKKDCGPS